MRAILLRLVASRLISEQHVGTYRDGCHEPPSGTWNSIPEGRLCVALRIDHVVHASKHQRRNRSWLCARRSADCGPAGLQLADRLVDLHLSSLITIEEEQYPLVELNQATCARLRRLLEAVGRHARVRSRSRWLRLLRSSCGDRSDCWPSKR